MDAKVPRQIIKKRFFIWLVIVIAILALFFVPIKVKQAVKVNVVDKAAATSMEMYIGRSVTLLCEYADHQVTEPPQYEFVVLAVMGENNTFMPFAFDAAGNPTGKHGLYVSPRHFVGGAIKKYNYGYKNRFVLCGVLNAAPVTKDGSCFGDFSMRLDSWDVVYPVHHFEYVDAGNERYRNSLFIFDYLLP